MANPTDTGAENNEKREGQQGVKSVSLLRSVLSLLLPKPLLAPKRPALDG
jgi:hypothetical protein